MSPSFIGFTWNVPFVNDPAVQWSCRGRSPSHRRCRCSDRSSARCIRWCSPRRACCSWTSCSRRRRCGACGSRRRGSSARRCPEAVRPRPEVLAVVVEVAAALLREAAVAVDVDDPGRVRRDSGPRARGCPTCPCCWTCTGTTVVVDDRMQARGAESGLRALVDGVVIALRRVAALGATGRTEVGMAWKGAQDWNGLEAPPSDGVPPALVPVSSGERSSSHGDRCGR